MAENMIKFLRGNVASLPETATAGAVYFTKDEGLYLGLADGTYHRYGDFIEVADVASLPTDGAHIKAMYYCTAENILAKWNGTKWVQINKQQTLDELGGVANSVYEAKMALLEKADTDNATAISGVDTRLQAAEEKLKSVATTEGLSELTKTVEGHTALIDTINGDENTAGSMLKIAKDAADSKDAAIEAAQNAADKAQGDVDTLAQTHATDKEALEGAIAAKADADNVYTKDDIDGKVDTINGAIDLKANAADVYNKDDVDGMVDDLEAADLAINNLIGDVTAGKTVVEMIADAQSAATYDDEEVRGLIDTNTQAIEQEVSDREGAISDLKDELEGKITGVETSVATEKSRAEGIEAGLRTDVDAIKADYLKAADKEDLQTQINTIMNNPDTEGVINSINEFTQYISDHGEIAEGFRADIDANKKAISDHETLAAQTYETKADATAKYNEVKDAIAAVPQADWNQNDPTALDYVKNRPFYEDGEQTIISTIPLTNVSEGSMGKTYTYIPNVDEFVDALDPNEEYQVSVNGKKYTLTKELETDGRIRALYISNGIELSNGQTMGLSVYPTAYDFNGELSILNAYGTDLSSYTVIFYKGIATLKQLDEKFIPDTIARVSDVEDVAGRMTDAEGKITTLEQAVDNLGDMAQKDVVSEADLDADLAAKVNAYADVQSDLDTHVNNADIHVTTDDKAKWNAAEQNAKDYSDGKLDTAKTELEGKISDAETAAKGHADTEVGKVQTALDEYKEDNDAVVAGKADKATTLAGYGITDAMTADDIIAMFTWGEFGA